MTEEAAGGYLVPPDLAEAWERAAAEAFVVVPLLDSGISAGALDPAVQSGPPPLTS